MTFFQINLSIQKIIKRERERERKRERERERERKKRELFLFKSVLIQNKLVFTNHKESLENFWGKDSNLK